MMRYAKVDVKVPSFQAVAGGIGWYSRCHEILSLLPVVDSWSCVVAYDRLARCFQSCCRASFPLLSWFAPTQVSSQMEKKTKVTIKRKTYFDEQDSDDNDDDMM